MINSNGKFIHLYNGAILDGIDMKNNLFAQRVTQWLKVKEESGDVTFSQANFVDFLNIAIKENMTEYYRRFSEETSTSLSVFSTDRFSQKKEATSIVIKGLAIKNFRKFSSSSDFTFKLKSFGCFEDSTTNDDNENLPQSWFLIGENGVGKSSVYSALEYLMTKQISEGEFRNKDFVTQVNRASIKLITNDRAFQKENDIRDFYCGNSMLAIFCSENDIFQIGRKLDSQNMSYNDGNIALFASLMGYDDIVEILAVLKMFLQDIEEKERDKHGKQSDKERSVSQENILSQEIETLEKTKKSLLKKLISQYALTSNKGNVTTVNKRQGLDPIKVLYQPLCEALKAKKSSTLKRQINSLISQYEKVKDSLNLSDNTSDSQDEYKKIVLSFNELKALLIPSPVKKGQISLNHETELNVTGVHNILQKINDSILLCMSNAPIVQTVKEFLTANSNLESKKREKEDLPLRENLPNNIKDLQNYIDLIEDKLYETVKLEYAPYQEFIIHTMEKFKLSSEKFKLSINFENKKMELLLHNEAMEDSAKEIYLPSFFYNAFRYKLFCLLLKIACGLAYMKKRNIRIPIILDDVFYGSDFYSRTHVKQFFEILMEQIKSLNEETKGTKEEKNNFIQIICFTHDEIILNAIMDVMMAGENQNEVRAVFGRIIDAEYIVRTQSKNNENEGGIYLKF